MLNKQKNDPTASDSSPTKMNGFENICLNLLRAALGKDIEIVFDERSIFGQIDFYVPTLKMAIFCDGEFWHDSNARMTQTALRFLADGEDERAGFWADKAEKNKARDREVNRALKERGITVVRLKERSVRRKGLTYVSQALSRALFKKPGPR